MERLRFYNPILSGGDTDQLHQPNQIASLATDGLHYPALDIDIPMRVVESSTPGHHHVYFDELGLTWRKYKRLLKVLADVGIMERDGVEISLAQQMTLLIPPGMKKTKKHETT